MNLLENKKIDINEMSISRLHDNEIHEVSYQPLKRILIATLLALALCYWFVTHLLKRPKAVTESSITPTEIVLTKETQHNVSAFELIARMDKGLNPSKNSHDEVNKTFIDAIKVNQKVVEVQLCNDNSLAISVLNNGSDFSNMALHYFRMAKNQGYPIKAVRIFDAMNSDFNVGKNGLVHGKVLAESIGI